MGELTPYCKKNIAVSVAFAVTILYAIYFYSIARSSLALGFASIVILADIILYIVVDRLYNKHVIPVDGAFLIVLIFLGLMFCFVFTPGSVPDEFYHFLASYRYTDTIFLQANDVTGLEMRADDFDFYNSFLSSILNRENYVNLSQASFLVQDTSIEFLEKWQGSDFGNNLPQEKLPSVLGILLGRLLGLGSYPLFYLGRLFNFAFFIVLVFFAIRITPIGKNIMRIAALLPMTLHLAASYSYDAGIIGMAFLLTAFCLKAIRGTGPIEKRTCIGILVLAILLAPCKIIYCVISLSIFLIPNNRFSSKKTAWLFKYGTFALGLLAIALIRAPALLEMSGVEAEDSSAARDGQEGEYYTFGNVIENPVKFIIIIIRTFIVMMDNYIYTMVGRSLGWFQQGIEASWMLTVAFLALLLVSALSTPEDSATVKISHKVFFLALCLIAWVGVHLSMLIGWTFNTSPIIEGVQGRYIIPLLPLALLSLRNRTMVFKRNVTWALMFGMLLLNSIYMIQVFSIAITL